MSKKLLVIGASRGIGLEWVRQACAAGEQVTATARDEAGLARLRALGAKALRLDLLDAASCAGLAWLLDGESFDTAVVNAGVFGPRAAAPAAPSEADFQLVMQTNVLGPMRLLPTLQEALAPGARLVFLSSSMASIGARMKNSGWLYRASKAALNSVAKDASLLLEGRATVVALSPGWVKTDMGGEDADLELEDALARMRRSVAALTPADSGRYLDLDGKELPLVRVEIEDFLGRYAAAYERGDGDAVAAMCALPLVMAQQGQLHGWTETEALRDNMRRLCDAYREAGMVRALPRLGSLQALGDHDAFVLVHWRLEDANAQLLQAFDTGYQLHRGAAGGWRVSYVVAFSEALQALRETNSKGETAP